MRGFTLIDLLVVIAIISIPANPTGLNALWGDLHVSFSATKQAFDPKLWDPGDDFATQQNPGDNPKKFRTIVSLLRP